MSSAGVSYPQHAGLSAEQLSTGGYTIRTTMDPAVSRAAKDAVDAGVPTAQDGVADPFALVGTGHDAHQVPAVVADRNLGTDATAGDLS